MYFDKGIWYVCTAKFFNQGNDKKAA